MHSRVYAERMDKVQKKMIQAVASLRESGLVQAPESLPVDRDPRITELLRLEYMANVLEQLAGSFGVMTSGELIVGEAIVGELGEQIKAEDKIEILPPAVVNVGKSDKAKGKK